MRRLLEPAVAEAGFDLEDLDVRPAGRRRLVKVVVDADGGVGLDDIAMLSETASKMLDGSDVMGASPYVLEVTSPGVDRPLTEPRHWRRAVGRLVVASLTEGGEVEGRVVAADDEAVEIEIAEPRRKKGAGAGGDGTSAGSGAAGPDARRRRFGLGELGRGRVQVEFKAPPPGPAEETRSPAEPD
ncbi:ribosome maturation factor RimP [Actinomadura algeriensis]|uniref:ribosome maturation factor RimP n=1 Tax=Actinomadura algeriensis TaxID=1679523 RepID=UPI00178BD044|nr:ribosome maturation factor RimP [Actinomadura algeriensis]